MTEDRTTSAKWERVLDTKPPQYHVSDGYAEYCLYLRPGNVSDGDGHDH